MSVLGDVVAGVHESLQPHARGRLGEGEWEARVPSDRGFTMEAVYEGFLLHYGEPRSFSDEMEPDLRLLAGDSLYALGLQRIAERSDLEAVAELADLISGCAQAQAEGRPEGSRQLWENAAEALSS